MARITKKVYEIEVPEYVSKEDIESWCRNQAPQHVVMVRKAHNGSFKELDARREYDAYMAAG